MAMLSNLLRYTPVDGHGREGHLVDFAVDLSAGDYPPVSSILVRVSGKGTVQVPIHAVQSADHQARRIYVDDLDSKEPATDHWLARAVLLKRDIMDAMVLDLEDRLACRANDLCVEQHEGGFVLSAVDVSLRAILRRVSAGLVRGTSPRGLRDWRIVEFLRGDPLAARSGRDYHGMIERLPAGEIANLADALPYPHAAELVTLLPDLKAADTLESMMPERQLQVFAELAEDQAIRLLALMRPDIVADLIGRLDPDEARYWLEHMPSAQYRRVLHLLHYQEDTAGGIMTNDMIAVPGDMQVGAALAVLREQLKLSDFINFIQMIYVVDSRSDQRLQGVLSLRDLLVADEERSLAEIMDPYVIALRPQEPASSAARRVIDNQLPALPVIGGNGDLLGIVTVDAALGLAVPGTWGSRQAPRLFS